jgi:hypothetical protein
MRMSTFDEFAEPDLVLHLHGVVYRCPPPSVADSATIIALHIRARVQLGLDDGPVDQKVIDLIEEKASSTPLAALTLSQKVYDELVAAGESPMTINRMGYYGILYWARGAEYADWLAVAMWDPKAEEAAEAPKVQSPLTSGQRTGLGSRTKTASTPTTESPQS